MVSTRCLCGVEVTAAEHEALVAAMKAHLDTTHPELGINEPSIRNYLAAEARLDGPTERLDTIGQIHVRPVDADILDDVLEFFDRRAFADNPAWAMCYCMFYHLGGGDFAEWSERSWEENRADLATRIGAGSTTGVVAYVDGVLAGWCNASARSEFPQRVTGEGDDEVGSIVCFVVAPPYRGHGVARELLRGAVGMLAERGFRRAEAYPVVDPRDAASAFPGPVGLYTVEGFEIAGEDPPTVTRSL